MFGIGGIELMVIGVVLLIAVGPNKLPFLIKAGVKGYREFRKATRDLRASTGIDEILQDEDLRELRDLRNLRNPLDIPPAKPAASTSASTGGSSKSILGYAERSRESPPEGLDVSEARDAMHRPSAEESARIEAEKRAVIEAKVAASRQADGPVSDEERQGIIDAKNVAAEKAAHSDDGLDAEERQGIIDAKNAVAAEAAHSDDGLDAEERQGIIDAKNAAAESLVDDGLDAEERQGIIDAKNAAARAGD